MKIVGIVQARMGSSRLPNKVLMNILGKPMLWHIIDRVKRSEYINEVTIAATTDSKDEAILEFGEKYGIQAYQGSVNNIVDRYYHAAKLIEGDIIVRIWGDCPLIDPQLIDKLLKKFIENNYDYANNFTPRSYPRGFEFEIYSFKTLEMMFEKIDDRFYEKYPFDFVKELELKTFYEENKKDLSGINLTVDYPEDFKIISSIYEKLYKQDTAFFLEDVLTFLKDNPEFRKMNERLQRNIEYDDDKAINKKMM